MNSINIDPAYLTTLLGGNWRSHYGTAPCPICQPERRKDQDALTINYKGEMLLLHCKKRNCDFRDILIASGIVPGTVSQPDPAIIAQRERERKTDAKMKSQQALMVWNEVQPIFGTIAETYLRSRGITCELGETLGFHPAAWHGATRLRIPALVANIDVGEAFAIHRTYLRTDGRGKADVDPPKAMLGATAGGAVRLTQSDGALVVAEGIETALSLASGLLGSPATIWAALSTSGMRGLRLPADPGQIIIAADGDAAGQAAAQVLASRAYALGWTVSLLPAPDGCDWNDVLTTGGVVR